MESKGYVLVIDDDAARAAALAEIVSAAGYRTEVYTDVNAAYHFLDNNEDLDVILCELDLEDVSWVEARRSLRELDLQIPAIIFSDRAEVAKMMTALRLGASDFFVRPVEDTDALLNVSCAASCRNPANAWNGPTSNCAVPSRCWNRTSRRAARYSCACCRRVPWSGVNMCSVTR